MVGIFVTTKILRVMKINTQTKNISKIPFTFSLFFKHSKTNSQTLILKKSL